MEPNKNVEQSNSEQKESNMNLYPNQIPTNIEEDMQKLKEQLSTDQNAQISPPAQIDGKYPLDSENPNVNNNTNIQQNNMNSEIQENPQTNNAQMNNIPELHDMNGMDMQMNPQPQQINEQMMYQIPPQLQNNQEITINNYLINYRQTQNLEKSLNNKIEILELIDNELKNVHEEKLEYPCTKLLWSPNSNKSSFLATSSDCIQLYEYIEDTHKLVSIKKLNNNKSKYCGPLTSFDWNTVNDALLGTASLDTTCTIWDLNKFSIKTQLIAHDKEVFDIQFGNDENTFISGGADGSVRLFDLRSLNHSTIIYETKGSTPINKLAWNLQTSNLIAALSLDKSIIYIFDSRANSNVSMDELTLHKEPVTGIVWAPDNPTQLCSVSEDCSVIISNVHNEQLAQNTNVSYNAPSSINNVDWCKSFPEWIGITFQNKVQLLRK